MTRALLVADFIDSIDPKPTSRLGPGMRGFEQLTAIPWLSFWDLQRPVKHCCRTRVEKARGQHDR